MPSKSANVKNEKQYEALKDKGMSEERAAKIANPPGASKRGGKQEAERRRLVAGWHDRAEEKGGPEGRQDLALLTEPSAGDQPTSAGYDLTCESWSPWHRKRRQRDRPRAGRLRPRRGRRREAGAAAARSIRTAP